MSGFPTQLDIHLILFFLENAHVRQLQYKHQIPELSSFLAQD